MFFNYSINMTQADGERLVFINRPRYMLPVPVSFVCLHLHIYIYLKRNFSYLNIFLEKILWIKEFEINIALEINP